MSAFYHMVFGSHAGVQPQRRELCGAGPWLPPAICAGSGAAGPRRAAGTSHAALESANCTSGKQFACPEHATIHAPPEEHRIAFVERPSLNTAGWGRNLHSRGLVAPDRQRRRVHRRQLLVAVALWRGRASDILINPQPMHHVSLRACTLEYGLPGHVCVSYSAGCPAPQNCSQKLQSGENTLSAVPELPCLHLRLRRLSVPAAAGGRGAMQPWILFVSGNHSGY